MSWESSNTWVGKYTGCSKEQPYFLPNFQSVGWQTGKQCIKKGVRIKIQPRFKIQYPMKNRNKDMRKHSHLQDGNAITIETLVIFYELF